MIYVLGVDGGGSKSACLLANERGKLLSYGQSGPINTNYVDRKDAVKSLKTALHTCLAGAWLKGEQIDTLCISAPMEPGAIEEIVHEFKIKHVLRAAEGETPRWAVRYWVEGYVGVTVDAGTGSMARAWNKVGKEANAGGWGTALGDEGSGFWIGMQAMRAVLQAFDGRIEKTMLTKPVLEHLGMTDLMDIVFRADERLVRLKDMPQIGVIADSGKNPDDGVKSIGGYRFREVSRLRSWTRDEIAGLCPVVAKIAQGGDWKALEIFREAGYELGRLGAAVIHRLQMDVDEFAVVPFGGVFRAGEIVLQSFRETVLSAAKHAKVVGPPFEPVVGAVLLALDDLGVVIDHSLIQTMEQSSFHFPACKTAN